MTRTALVTVYAIREFEEGPIRYVGQTSQPLWKRLADHVAHACAEDCPPILRWLYSIYASGRYVHISALQESAPRNSAEKEWIRRLTAEGVDLLNIEHCASKRAAISRAKFADPAMRARHSEAMRAAFGTEARKQEISLRFAGVPKTVEHKEAIRASHVRRLKEVPGAFATLSARAIGLAKNEKRIANSRATHQTDECRAAKSARASAMYAERPEIKEKIAAKARERWARWRAEKEASHAHC